MFTLKSLKPIVSIQNLETFERIMQISWTEHTRNESVLNKGRLQRKLVIVVKQKENTILWSLNVPQQYTERKKRDGFRPLLMHCEV